MQLKMTLRAKSYLWVRAVAHFAVAALCLIIPVPVEAVLPPVYTTETARLVWGLLSLGTAGVLAYAAVQGSEQPARNALMGSLAVTGGWVGAHFVAVLNGIVSAPVGLVAWLTVLMVDLIMLRRPLSTPFEDLLKHLD